MWPEATPVLTVEEGAEFESIPGLECAETRENDCVTTPETLTRHFLELLLRQH